jgi:hypothetical protein
MKRREFIASLLISAVTPGVEAQQPAKSIGLPSFIRRIPSKR